MSAYNISLTAGHFTTQLIWRIENNQFEIIDPSGVIPTVFIPFTSTTTQNQQFQATFDGSQYIVVLTWNMFDERYYINVYSTAQVLILCIPMVGSPSTSPEPAPAPVVLVAEAGNTEITFSWNSSPTADRYNLYWSTTSGEGESGTLVADITSNEYLLVGLTNGTTYYAVVTAVNGSGQSPISNQVSATPNDGIIWVNNLNNPVSWINNASQAVVWVS